MDILALHSASKPDVMEWTNNLSLVLNGQIVYRHLKQRQSEITVSQLMDEMLWIGDYIRFRIADRICQTHRGPRNNIEGVLPVDQYDVLERLVAFDRNPLDAEELIEIMKEPVEPISNNETEVPMLRRNIIRLVAGPDPDERVHSFQCQQIMKASFSRWQFVLLLNPEPRNVVNTTEFSQVSQQYQALFDSYNVRVVVMRISKELAMRIWGEIVGHSLNALQNTHVHVVIFEFIGIEAWIEIERKLSAMYLASRFAKQCLRLPEPLMDNRAQIPHQIRVRTPGVPALPNSTPATPSANNANRNSAMQDEDSRLMHNDLRVPDLNQLSLQRMDNILDRIGRDAPSNSAMARVFGDSNMRGLVIQPNYYPSDRDSMYQRLSHQDWRTWNGIYSYNNSMTYEQRQSVNPSAATHYDFSAEARQLWSNFWKTMLRNIRQHLPVEPGCFVISPFRAKDASQYLHLANSTEQMDAILFGNPVVIDVAEISDIYINVNDQVNRDNNVNDSVMVSLVQEASDYNVIKIIIRLQEVATEQHMQWLQQMMKREFPTLMREDKMNVQLFFRRHNMSTSLHFAFVQSGLFKQMSRFKHESMLRTIHTNINPRPFGWEFKDLPPTDHNAN